MFEGSWHIPFPWYYGEELMYLKVATVSNTAEWILLFSCSVVYDSLGPRGLQHARLLCPLPFPEVCSSSCSLSQWYHQNLVLCHPLLLLPSIFPSIRVFYSESAICIRWPKYWSFSFSISPSMNIQDWFPLGKTGRISLLSKGLFSNTTIWKHQLFGAQASLWSSSHIHTWLLEKP